MRLFRALLDCSDPLSTRQLSPSLWLVLINVNARVRAELKALVH